MNLAAMGRMRGARESAFLLLVFCISSAKAQSKQVARPNEPCNPDTDVLLMDNPLVSPAAFLRCASMGIGGIGYWSQNFCPAGMIFDFLSQQCKYPSSANSVDDFTTNSVRKEGELNIAILNGTCTRGEQCIGGTVCDRTQGRCLCPFGTVANLETLSCTATPSLSNAMSQVGAGAMLLTGITAKPGDSCANGQQCVGGSFCVSSLGKCLCPMELENVNGQCVRPAAGNGQPSGTMKIKLPLHSACGNMVECDGGGQCLNGFCQCVPPSVELNNQCYEKTSTAPTTSGTKLAGPGELCNNGETCTRGSVCDSKIPVCVCPLGTDLENGACVRVRTTLAALNTFYAKPTKTYPDQQSQQQYGRYGPQPQVEVQTVKPLLVQQPAVTNGYVMPSPQVTLPMVSTATATLPVAPTVAPASPPTLAVNTLRPPNPFRITSNKKIAVGQACTLNADCVADAYCNGHTRPPSCQCLNSHVDIGGKCDKIIYPGQSGCGDDKQCAAAFPGAQCRSGECVCPPGLMANEQSCIVVPIPLSKPCNSSWKQNLCVQGANCVDSECQCMPPLLTWNDKCVGRDVARLRETDRMACVDVSDCPLTFNCIMGECECPSTTRRINGRCTVDALLALQRNPEESDTSLQTFTDDYTDLDGETMSKRTAESLEKIFNVLMKMKLETIDAENSTTFDDDKNLTNENITSDDGGRALFFWPDEKLDDDVYFGTESTQIVSERKKRSIKEAASVSAKIIGEPCMDGDICMNGTSCVNGTCSCPDGYEMKTGKCKKLPKSLTLNEQCDPAVDECQNGAACRHRICVCVDGSLEHKSKCRQRIGGACRHGEECGGGAECNAGKKKCQCPKGFIEEGRKCVRRVVAVNEPCDGGQLCQGSVCRGGRCVCASEDYEVLDGKCVRVRLGQDTTALMFRPPRTEPPSSTTPRTVKTTVKPSKTKATTANKSTKPPKMVKQKKMHSKLSTPPSQQQFATSKPGQLCTEGEACTGGSICKDGLCSCSDDEIIIADKCVNSDGEALQAIERITKSSPGQLCTEDTVCTGNSICLSGVCVCPEGTTLFRGECLAKGMGSDMKTLKAQASLFSLNALDALDGPVKTVVPGAMCHLSLECPYRTECIRGVCRCQRGETIVNGMCRRAIHEVPPGGRCDSQKGLDCVGESHCFYGICVCLYGLVTTAHECTSSDVLQTVDPGRSCELGQQCGGGSECIAGVCECPKDTVLDTEKSQCLKSKPTGKGFFSYPDKEKSGEEKPESLVFGNGEENIPAGRFNQILSAKQMSINVVDLETLKALIGGQFNKLAGNSGGGSSNGNSGTTPDRCDDTYCANGARCVRGLCQCVDGPQDENGYCQPNTDQTSGMGSSVGSSGDNGGYQSGGGSVDLTNGGQVDQQPLTQEALYQQYQQQQQLQQQLMYQQQQQVYGQQMPYYVPGGGYGSMMSGGMNPYCPPNMYCYGSQMCNNGMCVCRPGYRPFNGACQLHRVALGEPCHINEQCVTNGICQDGLCSCGRGVQFRHRHRCPDRTTARPGEDCTNNQACSYNSVCGTVSGVCECPVGLETSIARGSGECVVTARPRGTFCLASAQCHKNSYCDNGYCMCKAGFMVGPDGVCLPQPRAVVDDPNIFLAASPPKHAAPAHTPPINLGIAFAPPKLSSRRKSFNNEDKRVKVVSAAAPGEFCAHTKLCSGNSHCVHGFCKCPEGMKVSGRRCSSPLSAHREIRRSAMSHMSKLKNLPPRHHSLVQPFSRCDLNDRCVEGAVCTNRPLIGRICICNLDRVFFMGLCIRRRDNINVVPLAAACSPSDICANGSECIKNTCRCPGDRREKAGYCVKEAKPGESCQHDEFCAPNSICRAEVGACVCPMGSMATDAGCTRSSIPIPSRPNGAPIKNTLPGQLCDSSTRCTNGSICAGFGVCECPSTFALVYGMCVEAIRVKEPGDPCDPAENICSANSWCQEGVCRCLNKRIPHEGKCAFNYLDVNVNKSMEAHPANPGQLTGNYLSHVAKHENVLHLSSANVNLSAVTPSTGIHQMVGPEPPRLGLATTYATVLPARLHGPGRPGSPISGPPKSNNMKSEASADATPDHALNPKIALAPPQPAADDFVLTQNLVNNVHHMLHPQEEVQNRSINVPNIFDNSQNYGFFEPPMIRHVRIPDFTTAMPSTSAPRRMPMPEPGNDHIRIFKLQHQCHGGTDCPIGSYCMYSRCFCDQIPLRNTTRVTAGHCRTSQDCIEPLTCVGTQCICVPPPTATNALPFKPVRPAPPMPKPLEITPSERIPESPRPSTAKPTRSPRIKILSTSRPVSVEEVVDVDNDYEEPDSLELVTTPKDMSRRRNVKSTTPLPLPVHVECSTSKDCALDAECRRGRCHCLDPKKYMRLNRDGRAVCEFVRGVIPTTTEEPVEADPHPAPKPGEAGWKCEFSAQCNRRLTCVQGICTCVAAVDNPCGTDIYGAVGERASIPPTVRPRVVESRVVRPRREVPTEIPPGGSCAAGEKCVGGAVCHRGWCVCPDPLMVIHAGECKKPTYQQAQNFIRPTASPAPAPPPTPPASTASPASPVATGSARTAPTHPAQLLPAQTAAGVSFPAVAFGSSPAPGSGSLLQPRIVPPGKNCGPLDKCAGGSICVSGFCLCPSGMAPNSNGVCEVRKLQNTANPPMLAEVQHHMFFPPFLNASRIAQKNFYNLLKPSMYGQNRWPTYNKSIMKPALTSKNMSTSLNAANDCAKRGLICRNGAICVDRTCQCPIDKVLINDQCVNLPPQYPLNECVKFHALRSGKYTAAADALLNSPFCKRSGFSRWPKKDIIDHLHAIERPAKRRRPQRTEEEQEERAISSSPPLSEIIYARPTESCANGEICTGGAVCQRKTKCVCPAHKPHIRNFICTHQALTEAEQRQPKASIACDVGNGCPESPYCEDGNCECPEGFIRDKDKCVRPARPKTVIDVPTVNAAFPKKHALPGQLCDQGQQCTGGSICDSVTKLCWCAKGHKIISGTCTRNVNSSIIGESCDNDKSCQSGSICMNGTCACTDGFVKEENFCTRFLKRRKFSSYRYHEASLWARRCHPEECKLPDCFCTRTDKTTADYREIFSFINFTSPSGCAVKGTFFISHEWTNYNEVEWLADEGHELASNSISHRLLTTASYAEWLAEMDGQRKMLARYANVDESQIVGMRAPQLGLGGDIQYTMALQSGFIYDHSIAADPGVNAPPFWPQTLDFSLPFVCESDHCPQSSIPGLWALPMNDFYSTKLKSPMLQGILDGSETDAEILGRLKQNFARFYERNRAPFIMTLTNDFLQRNGGTGMRALKSFLYALNALPDVHFMTLRELVDYMREPLTNEQLLTKRKCGLYAYTPTAVPRACLVANKCMYNTASMTSPEHLFYTCNRCPLTYPWVTPYK